MTRVPGSEAFTTEHLNLLADLIVSFVVTTAERLVDQPAHEERIIAATRTQLRMLLIGALNWRSQR